MTWNAKYWDIIEQLYWSPRYTGLGSISQKHWVKKDGMVCIPEEMVNAAGPLYSRKRKASDLRNYLHGSEEILNHLFEITFSIASDAVIQKAFVEPLGFIDTNSFESIGRECVSRYGWRESENVTQHDGFFVSDTSAIAIELKLLTTSWPEQVAKYAAMFAWEELYRNTKQNLGLLYIVPEHAKANFWQRSRFEPGSLNRNWLDRSWDKSLPKPIVKLFETNEDTVRSVLDRMKVHVISWTDLRNSLLDIQSALNQQDPGQQTLYRLLAGFLKQLSDHRDTGITLNSL